MGDGCIGDFLVDGLFRYLGQTVTIFTTSGGISGSGFTGVLAGICDGTVKLITDIGAAPACPVGSSCTGYGTPYGYANNYGYGGYGLGGYGLGGYGYGLGGYGYGGWGYGGYGGYGYGLGAGCGNNWLGSVTEIPIKNIVSFTHNAI
ncbi:MAG: hypothetical protein LBU36_05825 [Clostridiales bacterium]|jgi:hypothetical protein|nr:hypothetical protein [Clostridiales bacterium]